MGKAFKGFAFLFKRATESLKLCCFKTWFIVSYKEAGAAAEVILDEVRYTTLERAVEGLTAGIPVGMQQFEEEIADTLKSKAKAKMQKIIDPV